MNPFGLGPVVRLVNRVVDDKGERVPWEIRVGGDAFWIRETLDLPLGVARIAIHQSMYRIDPITHQASYRLGCADLGAPEDPVPVAETQRQELVDRSLLPPSRQKVQTVKLYNPINPRASAPQPGPRPNENGVLPGEFGERV